MRQRGVDTMKYIFVDTDNGGAPSNATPDTSTSKYHTSSSWPANGARWSTLGGVVGDATIRGITDDITIYCIGAAADTTSPQFSSMTCASLTLIGNLARPQWDASKYRISGTATSVVNLFSNNITGAVTVRNLQVEANGSGTSAYPIAIAPTVNSLTHNVENCIVRFGSTARSSVNSACGGIRFSGSSTGSTFNVKNCISYQIGGSGASVTGNGIVNNISNAITLNVYNCVVYDVQTGGAVGNARGIAANAADTVTVKNCAVLSTGDDFLNCDTVAYCASDDGDGTNAQTSVTWTNEFVDYVNGDFTLKSGGTKLQGTGIGPSSDASVPSTDIAGVTRSGTTTDIGAAMYVASGLSITSVTPSSFDSGIAGIVIAGSGFGASQGSSTVDIGGQAQTVTAWSDTSITITSARGSNSMGSAQLKVTIR